MQRPHPPLHVAGESDAALRRAARIGQGWLGYLPVDRVPERLEVLGRLLAERGRARSSLQITIIPLEAELDLDKVKHLRDFGVDCVHTFAVALRPEDRERQLDQLAEEIVVPARGL